jgi:hypothetical protein
MTATRFGRATMTSPRSFSAKCAAIMHERKPEALAEAEVRDGWENW